MAEQDYCPCQVDYIGELQVAAPENVVLVESDRDYVQVCRDLSQQLGAKEGLSIWVRNKTHFSWLKDFVEQIDLECNFHEKTVRQVLADQWNVSIPDWLADRTILEQGLLELKVVPHPHDSFSNRLLTHLLGDAFQGGLLSAANLVTVIGALTAATAGATFKKYPIVSLCLKAKCEEWALNSPDKWTKDISDRIAEDFQELWETLSFWSVLHAYPKKLLEYVLSPPNVSWVTKVPHEAVEEIFLEPTAREQALTQIDMFFKNVGPQVKSSEDFRKVLECASGHLVQEFKHVWDLIKSSQFAVAMEDVRRVQDKFKSCPGVTASQLGLLSHCVMPVHPVLIEENKSWSAREWMRWTVDEYVPYRTWQVYNNSYDEQLEGTVRGFSDWYIREYANVHKDPDLSLVHALREVATSGEAKQVAVVLLIDCLPVQFMGLLDDALRNSGFSMHDRRYRFAPLPSTTAQNKTMLLSGEWECSDKDYESLLKARAAKDWGGCKVVYLSTLKALSEVELQDESAVVVFNFVDSDDLLHQDVESKNTSHQEELHRLFHRISEAVRGLCDRWTGQRENFNVYVTTDHGACRILDEEKRSFDSALINKLFPNEKHRFSSVDAAKAGDVPENLWVLGYKFHQPFYSDGKVYFLPKGHNTVRFPGKGKGFLHGGATPEEVIVPTALYKAVKVAWKHPFARFLGLNLDRETGKARFYIQRVVSLEIELQNPNSSAVRIIRASVLSPETDLKGCGSPVLGPGESGVLRMECYFQKAALEESSLMIEITYEIAEEAYTLSLPLDCQFRSAVSTGFSLKDLS